MKQYASRLKGSSKAIQMCGHVFKIIQTVESWQISRIWTCFELCFINSKCQEIIRFKFGIITRKHNADKGSFIIKEYSEYNASEPNVGDPSICICAIVLIECKLCPLHICVWLRGYSPKSVVLGTRFLIFVCLIFPSFHLFYLSTISLPDACTWVVGPTMPMISKSCTFPSLSHFPFFSHPNTFVQLYTSFWTILSS